jgi:CubicO group peptidase (beta-lactamase class C family)
MEGPPKRRGRVDETGSGRLLGLRGVRARLRLPVLLGLPLAACAGQPVAHQLYPIGGDQFSLVGPTAPMPDDETSCPGAGADVFACFMADLRPRLDRAAASAAVAVFHDGAVYAAVHAPPGRPRLTTDTRFALASATKTVVAATAMVLAESGELDLHRPIRAYLPELTGHPAGAATAHHLLTHTSGLPDLGGADGCEPGSQSTTLLSQLADRALLVEPGLVYNYSNTGYGVLGTVLERISERPAQEVVRAKVLAPLGMATAAFAPDAPGGVHVAPGDGRTLHRICGGLLPAGGLWASAPDLLRVLQMLLAEGAGLMRPQSAAAMQRAQTPTGTGTNDGYGYGMGTTSYRGLTLLEHHGRSPQFAATWAAIPARRFAVVVLVNSNLVPVAAARRAVRVFLGLTGPEPPRETRSLDHWSRYLGAYRDASGALGSLIVSMSSDRLLLRFDDHEPAIGLPPVINFFPADGREARFVVTPWGVAQRTAPPR